MNWLVKITINVEPIAFSFIILFFLESHEFLHNSQIQYQTIINLI